jgi:hypothetical protein
MPDIILVERNSAAFHETAMFSHEGTDMWRKRQRRDLTLAQGNALGLHWKNEPKP